MTEDRWSALSKRDADDEEEAALSNPEPQFDPTDPYAVAVLFMDCLRGHRQFLNALENLITPESREAWGDFSQAAAILESIEDMGISGPKPALGDSQVCYIDLLRGVSRSFEVIEAQIIFTAAAITLVWRPELGMWRVHAVGDAIPPELVPHGTL